MVVLVKTSCFRIKGVVFEPGGSIRAKWLYPGKCGCIRAKWLYSGKVVLFRQRWLYSGKNGCIQVKMFEMVQR